MTTDTNDTAPAREALDSVIWSVAEGRLRHHEVARFSTAIRKALDAGNIPGYGRISTPEVITEWTYVRPVSKQTLPKEKETP